MMLKDDLGVTDKISIQKMNYAAAAVDWETQQKLKKKYPDRKSVV